LRCVRGPPELGDWDTSIDPVSGREHNECNIKILPDGL